MRKKPQNAAPGGSIMLGRAAGLLAADFDQIHLGKAG